MKFLAFILALFCVASYGESPVGEDRRAPRERPTRQTADPNTLLLETVMVGNLSQPSLNETQVLELVETVKRWKTRNSDLHLAIATQLSHRTLTREGQTKIIDCLFDLKATDLPIDFKTNKQVASLPLDTRMKWYQLGGVNREAPQNLIIQELLSSQVLTRESYDLILEPLTDAWLTKPNLRIVRKLALNPPDGFLATAVFDHLTPSIFPKINKDSTGDEAFDALTQWRQKHPEALGPKVASLYVVNASHLMGVIAKIAGQGTNALQAEFDPSSESSEQDFETTTWKPEFERGGLEMAEPNDPNADVKRYSKKLLSTARYLLQRPLKNARDLTFLGFAVTFYSYQPHEHLTDDIESAMAEKYNLINKVTGISKQEQVYMKSDLFASFDTISKARTLAPSSYSAILKNTPTETMLFHTMWSKMTDSKNQMELVNLLDRVTRRRFIQFRPAPNISVVALLRAIGKSPIHDPHVRAKLKQTLLGRKSLLRNERGHDTSRLIHLAAQEAPGVLLRAGIPSPHHRAGRDSPIYQDVTSVRALLKVLPKDIATAENLIDILVTEPAHPMNRDKRNHTAKRHQHRDTLTAPVQLILAHHPNDRVFLVTLFRAIKVANEFRIVDPTTVALATPLLNHPIATSEQKSLVVEFIGNSMIQSEGIQRALLEYASKGNLTAKGLKTWGIGMKNLQIDLKPKVREELILWATSKPDQAKEAGFDKASLQSMGCEAATSALGGLRNITRRFDL